MQLSRVRRLGSCFINQLYGPSFFARLTGQTTIDSGHVDLVINS